MKTIKTILAAATVCVLSLSALASYVFSWELEGVTWQNYDYAVIAAYDQGTVVHPGSGLNAAGYLYQAGATGNYNENTGLATSLAGASKAGMDGMGTADISQLMSLGQSYYYWVEMYSGNTLLYSSYSYYTYESLIAGFEYQTGTAAPTTTNVRSVTVLIPEPTSALLMLVGMGLLALRRKRATYLAALLAVCMVGGMAMAAENDAVVTFGTTGGNDTYADGAKVLDGERYALVYADDPALVAFGANGGVTGGELVVMLPCAKNGSCPTLAVQVSAKLGTDVSKFRLFLLDTRVTNGETVALAPGGSQPTAIAGYAPVEGASVAVTKLSDLPADFPKPRFSNIEVLEDSVVLTLTNTVDYVRYAVKDTETAAKNGVADGEIKFIVPKRDEGQIFRLERK